jgi:hypothetical protein
VWLIDEKTGGQKFCATVPLSKNLLLNLLTKEVSKLFKNVPSEHCP